MHLNYCGHFGFFVATFLEDIELGIYPIVSVEYGKRELCGSGSTSELLFFF